ncbi:MAG: hypothetical protein AAGL96_17960 [Pseudomonadota bacterium]
MITYRRSVASMSVQLEAAKTDAKEQIVEAVRVVRLKYVTDMPGQELIYNEKRIEAERYLSILPRLLNLDGYPFIEAEVGITGATAEEVAQVFLARAGLWVQVGAALEAIRLSASHSIEASTTVAEIDAALATLYSSLSVF